MLTGETWFFLPTVKNYRSAHQLACRQSLLVLSSDGRAKARVARAGWPEHGWPASTPAPTTTLCDKKGPKWPRERVLCSEDLRSWWDGGEEVTYWWTGKCGASFPRKTWLPKHRYAWGALLAWILIFFFSIFFLLFYEYNCLCFPNTTFPAPPTPASHPPSFLILLQTLICSFSICDGRQAVNKSYFVGFFFGSCRPLPSPLLGLGMNTQSQGFPFPS